MQTTIYTMTHTKYLESNPPTGLWNVAGGLGIDKLKHLISRIVFEWIPWNRLWYLIVCYSSHFSHFVMLFSCSRPGYV